LVMFLSNPVPALSFFVANTYLCPIHHGQRWWGIAVAT
jgi:hypothetical protein